MKRFFMFLLAATVLFSLAGCTDPGESSDMLGSTETPVTIVAIAGNTANTPLVSCRKSNSMMNLLNEAFHHSTSTVYIIEGDGNPYLIDLDNNTYTPPGSGYTRSSRKRDIKRACENFASAIDSARPKTKEVDMVSALNMAADIFKSTPQSVNVLLIPRNMFSTSGVLNFAAGALDVDPDEVIRTIETAGAIPDLTGVTVYADHLYEAGGIQPKLGYKQLAAMQAVSEKLFATSGAQTGNMFSIPKASSGDAQTDKLPDCTVIIPKLESITFREEPYVIDEDVISFIGDQAEYVNPEEAETVLQPIAESLIDSGESVYLIGSTASGQDAYCEELSQKRSERVKESLVALGVPSAQIQCIGLGCKDPDHKPDTDAVNHLVESIARQNRKVVITSTGSEYAKRCGLK